MASLKLAARIPGKDPLASAEAVLAALTDLLSCSSSSSGSSQPSTGIYEWSDIPWEHSSDGCSKSQCSETEGSGCDFSSFPSLSLQKNVCAASDISEDQILLQGKEDVEAHVAALLARPVLVRSGHDGNASPVEDSDDEGSEFMEANIADVTSLMQQNLVLSLSTLVQSRLRAYTSFLARHGLSMAKSKSVQELEEGAAVVNQKLETMLEIGSLISPNSVRTIFTTQTEKASTDCDAEDVKTSLPLSLSASIQVVIPRLQGKAEVLSADIKVAGTITGKSMSGQHLLVAT